MVTIQAGSFSRMRNKLVAFAMFLLLAFTCAQAAQITGDYVETRSADIYTGPCFANSEVGLVGDQAILAWHVKDGVWQGENLNGLAVVAAVKANSTLGDPFGNPYPAKAVLIVDQRQCGAAPGADRVRTAHGRANADA